jgi:secretion/DNA translocation related TadE-like protein
MTGRDRGAASLLLLAIGLVFVAAGVAGAAVGAARVARHRAQIAADLGALAGAARAIEGSEAACAQAARIAAANQGRVRSCVLQGLEIVVRADVTVEPLPGLARRASAAARAGPVTVAAPTGPWTGP